MNSPRWCTGKCGDGEMCADSTYKNGYCINPKDRMVAMKINETIGREVIKKKPNCFGELLK